MPIERVETLDEIPVDDMIDSKHAARIAKCHLNSLYRWINSGLLRGWRRCGRTFVSRHELLALFEPIETQREKAVNEIPTRTEVKRMKKWTHDQLLRRGVIQA